MQAHIISLHTINLWIGLKHILFKNVVILQIKLIGMKTILSLHRPSTWLEGKSFLNVAMLHIKGNGA